MIDTTLFYSWQSNDMRTNKHVEKVLVNVLAGLAEDRPSLFMAPRLDKDTKDTVGAVNIVSTIKAKIDNCGIFLADVSMAEKSESGELLVNQNVMFELGYAMARKGESSIILVANEDFGNVKMLPFDISHNRVVRFSTKKDKGSGRFKGALQYAVEAHMNDILKNNAKETAETLKEKLLHAIDQDKPLRSIAEKYFDHAYKMYLEIAPPRYDGSYALDEYGPLILDSYSKSKLITEEIHEILVTASEYHKADVLQIAYKQLGILLRYYDIAPEDNNRLHEASKDYYELVVYEVAVLLLGCIAKDKNWGLLQEIFVQKIRTKSYRKPYDLERLYGYPETALNTFKKSKKIDYTIPMTPLIAERYENREDILQTYLDGSILMYFAVGNYPWPIGILLGDSWQHRFPEFIAAFRKKKLVAVLTEINDCDSLEQYREKCWGKVTKGLGNFSYSYYNLVHVFSEEGIKSKDDIAGDDLGI